MNGLSLLVAFASLAADSSYLEPGPDGEYLTVRIEEQQIGPILRSNDPQSVQVPIVDQLLRTRKYQILFGDVDSRSYPTRTADSREDSVQYGWGPAPNGGGLQFFIQLTPERFQSLQAGIPVRGRIPAAIDNRSLATIRTVYVFSGTSALPQKLADPSTSNQFQAQPRATDMATGFPDSRTQPPAPRTATPFPAGDQSGIGEGTSRLGGSRFDANRSDSQRIAAGLPRERSLIPPPNSRLTAGAPRRQTNQISDGDWRHNDLNRSTQFAQTGATVNDQQEPYDASGAQYTAQQLEYERERLRLERLERENALLRRNNLELQNYGSAGVRTVAQDRAAQFYPDERAPALQPPSNRTIEQLAAAQNENVQKILDAVSKAAPQKDPAPATTLPQASEAGIGSGTMLREEEPRPWGPLLLTTFALFTSLGANAYLGWLAWSFYWRFRDVASDVVRARNHSSSRQAA